MKGVVYRFVWGYFWVLKVLVIVCYLGALKLNLVLMEFSNLIFFYGLIFILRFKEK